MGKELGKIQGIRMGYGGYQDAMLGITIDLGGEGWGCGDFKGTWASRSDGAKWTVEEQRAIFADTVVWLKSVLDEAKVDSLEKLKGKPIEATFEGNALKSWRILKEVI